MPALLTGLDDYVRLDDTAPARADRRAYVEQLLDIHPVGGPTRCRERLADAAALPGVRHLLLMVEAGGGRQPTLDNIARLATEVLEPAGATRAAPARATGGPDPLPDQRPSTKAALPR
jgi:hypothetical protein